MLFPPPTPPRPPLPFFAAVYYVVSGGWLADIGKAIGEALNLIIGYFLTFAGLTLLSFVSALYCWRKRPAAKWLVLLNVPGMAFIGYVVVMSVVESLQNGNL
jgi:hypothetical protein